MVEPLSEPYSWCCSSIRNWYPAFLGDLAAWDTVHNDIRTSDRHRFAFFFDPDVVVQIGHLNVHALNLQYERFWRVQR